jgi:hypothetical protein
MTKCVLCTTEPEPASDRHRLARAAMTVHAAIHHRGPVGASLAATALPRRLSESQTASLAAPAGECAAGACRIDLLLRPLNTGQDGDAGGALLVSGVIARSIKALPVPTIIRALALGAPNRRQSSFSLGSVVRIGDTVPAASALSRTLRRRQLAAAHAGQRHCICPCSACLSCPSV